VDFSLYGAQRKFFMAFYPSFAGNACMSCCNPISWSVRLYG
jgi:hypothetical protein